MTEEQIRAIVNVAVEAALARLIITGPGVSGSAKTGWVINLPPATATCQDDGTIVITFG